MIKVLVVDDSSFMRKVISDILNYDSQIKVIDAASNGLEAIEKIKKLKPDVVTLDIKMPDISGLDVLNEVMEKYPTPIIIISAYAKEGAKESILAYEYGAIDVIAKPSGEVSFDLKNIKDKIINSVKKAAIADMKKLVIHREKKVVKSPSQSGKELIVMGSSTGGPQAVFNIISDLPRNFPIPVVIVQHMPELFTGSFAERLNSRAQLRVKLAEQDEILKEGQVYVAPGGHDLEIIRKGKALMFNIEKQKNEKELTPSINMAFSSAAKACTNKVIAIELTGMGYDGLEGARELKKQGSLVICQDKNSSVVYGMPKEIAEAGLADFVISLDKISSKIVELISKSYKDKK